MDILKNYISVSADILPEGFSFSCWMCPLDLWKDEEQKFPYIYHALSDRCTWLIHCNIELTVTAVAMIAEQADRICKEQAAHNDRRKLSNR